MPKYKVTEAAMRPASTIRQCFYCHEPIGGEHLDTCVLVCKKIKVRMTVEYDVKAPAHWDARRFEFQRNEGTWCAGNAVGELEEYGCLCGMARFEYIGEHEGTFLEEQ